MFLSAQIEVLPLQAERAYVLVRPVVEASQLATKILQLERLALKLRFSDFVFRHNVFCLSPAKDNRG